MGGIRIRKSINPLIGLLFCVISIANVQSVKMATSNDFKESNKILSDGIRHFGEELFLKINERSGKNVIFSPLSVHSAISMVSLGAKKDSECQAEILESLGYKRLIAEGKSLDDIHKSYQSMVKQFKESTLASMSLNDGKIRYGPRPPILDFWTKMITNKSFHVKDKYMNSLKTNYNTTLNKIDNMEESKALASEINKWGQEAGFGDELVNPKDLITGSGGLNLMSAIKVQGWWEKRFYELIDDEGSFYNAANPKVPVKGLKVLRARDFSGKYAIFSTNQTNEHLKRRIKTNEAELNQMEFHIAAFPLEGMSFILIEPLKQETGNELNQLEETLFSNKRPNRLLTRALNIVQDSRETFELVQMPKFQFQSDIDLKPVLEAVGLKKIFKPREADLTEISEDSGMFVDKVKQRAVIEVNQHGLKAAAVTTIELMATSLIMPQYHLRMVVERPFLFLIRYQDLTLFMGHVVQL